MITDPPPGPDRLLHLLEQGRLIRNAWASTNDHGQETLCWLSALYDEVAEAQDPEACPAELAPRWLAHVVPCIDDYCSADAWESLARRLAEQARSWPRMTPESWDRVKIRWSCEILEEAQQHLTVDEWGVGAALEGVRQTLRADCLIKQDAESRARTAVLSACGGVERSGGPWISWGNPALLDEFDQAARVAIRVATSATSLASDIPSSMAAAATAAGEAATHVRPEDAPWDRLGSSLLDLIDAEISLLQGAS